MQNSKGGHGKKKKQSLSGDLDVLVVRLAGFIFQAFAPKLIQAGWVHRDRTNLSLLGACQADTRDALVLDAELKNYQAGTASGDKGPFFRE